MTSNLQDPRSIDDLLLYRLSLLLAAGGAPVIRLCEGSLGITWREWRVIASLRPGVSMRSSELAKHTQLDRPRTSKCITSLLAKGLIDRQNEPGDHRKAKVCLTEKGGGIYESFFPVVVQLNARLLQDLSPEELAVLDKAISNVQKQAEVMQGEDGLPKANRRRRGQSD
jgi:DNA-binding MarR family transcriptional regulator